VIVRADVDAAQGPAAPPLLEIRECDKRASISSSSPLWQWRADAHLVRLGSRAGKHGGFLPEQIGHQRFQPG